MCKENEQVKIIKCPKCGCEYTVAEIFVPESLTGRSHRVIKDALGKVLYVDYLDDEDRPDYVEHYQCDNCDTKFVVEAQMTFKTKLESEVLDFQNESVSLLDA